MWPDKGNSSAVKYSIRPFAYQSDIMANQNFQPVGVSKIDVTEVYEFFERLLEFPQTSLIFSAEEYSLSPSHLNKFGVKMNQGEASIEEAQRNNY